MLFGLRIKPNTSPMQSGCALCYTTVAGFMLQTDIAAVALTFNNFILDAVCIKPIHYLNTEQMRYVLCLSHGFKTQTPNIVIVKLKPKMPNLTL